MSKANNGQPIGLEARHSHLAYGETDTRADAHHVRSYRSELKGPALGEVYCQVYQSRDDGDRGGVVLKLGTRDAGGAMIPCAWNTPRGVELHLPGDHEARHLMRVLRKALADLEGNDE